VLKTRIEGINVQKKEGAKGGDTKRCEDYQNRLRLEGRSIFSERETGIFGQKLTNNEGKGRGV